MDELDLAYVAGLFDGEGSIGVYEYEGRFRPRCTVSNTDLGILTWLCGAWGGRVYVPKKHPARQQCYAWILCGRNIAGLLNDIMPYLKIKRPQAVRMLEFFGTGRSDKVRRRELVHELKELKCAVNNLKR